MAGSPLSPPQVSLEDVGLEGVEGEGGGGRGRGRSNTS